MSATIPPPTEQQLASTAMVGMATVLGAPPGSEPTWAKPAVAIFSLLLFAAMVAVAYATNDASMKSLLGGAAIGMAGASINYYLGSSSGSAKKTDLLAAAPALPTLPPA